MATIESMVRLPTSVPTMLAAGEAVRVMQPIQRLLDLGDRGGVGGQVCRLARQQIPSLCGFRVRNQACVLIERLLPQLRGVRAFVGSIEAALAGIGKKEQADEEAYEQNRGQRQVPASDLTKILTENFHLKCPRCRAGV